MSRRRAISLSTLVALFAALMVSGPAATVAESDGVPSIRGQVAWNQAWLTDWPPGTEITVWVDDDDSLDPGDPSTFLTTVTVTADAEGEATARFDYEPFQLEPGQYITATGGAVTKVLLIAEFDVFVNDVTGEVYGTTSDPDPSNVFEVDAFSSSGTIIRITHATSSWSVNLAAAPVGGIEQGQMSLPLPAGLQGGVMQTDEDDDATAWPWYLVWRGRFRDDDDSVFETNIDWLAEEGITLGCNPPDNDRFCPTSPVTRGQMAAFLVRALHLTDRLDDPFVDDDGSVFEADIERLAAAGVTLGCNPPDNDRFCPTDPVTRGQMAAFLVRALNYTDPGTGNVFVDDDGSIFEPDIARLATAGVTLGCNPPDNDRFCPTSSVTRGQMAAFLDRALN
jgi:hypothetical protein